MYVSVPQESQKDPVSLEAPHTVEPWLMTTQILWPLHSDPREHTVSHCLIQRTPLIQPTH